MKKRVIAIAALALFYFFVTHRSVPEPMIVFGAHLQMAATLQRNVRSTGIEVITPSTSVASMMPHLAS